MTTQSLPIAQRIFRFLFKTPQHISPPDVSVIATPKPKRKYASSKQKNKIKRIRTKLGLTQAQFGLELGCGQSAVAIYERNEQKIPVKTLQRLIAFAAKNGMTVSYDDIYGPVQKLTPNADEVAEARLTIEPIK